MLEDKWQTNLGMGVIDCDISVDSKRIIAGDVSGKLIVADYDGHVEQTIKLDLPIWGVDISPNGKSIAAGLALKQPRKGKVHAFVIDGKKTPIEIISFPTSSEVWDVKFVDDKRLFASTWNEGLYSFDLTEQKPTKANNISIEGSVFGISDYYEEDKQSLLLTSSGSGLHKLQMDSSSAKALLLSSIPIASYNNCINVEHQIAYLGSNQDIISKYSFKTSQTTHYRVLCQSPCGLALTSNYFLYGGLDGNLYVSPIQHPHTPVFHKAFPNSIWNISVDETASLVLIACGDGTLYGFQFVPEKARKSLFTMTNNSFSGNRVLQGIDIELLQGVNVFISYAHEDQKSAKLLYKSLSALGMKPWMDKESLLPGQDWRYEIRKAVRNADFFLICLSKKSVVKRGFVQKEIKFGLDILDQMPQGDIFLLPVRLEECDVPENMSERHWVDLFSEEGFHKLISAIHLQVVKKLTDEID